MDKKYLSQAYRLDKLINAKLEQVQRLKELATKTSSTLSPAKAAGGSEQSKVENCIVKIVDLENEINAAIDKLVDVKKNIQTAISMIEDNNLRLLLELRYLNYKSWEEIAVKMGYQWRHVMRLHKRALREIEKI